MKVALIGSGGLPIGYLGQYLPENTTEIITGGMKSIEISVLDYAIPNRVKFTFITPEQDIKEYSALLEHCQTLIRDADLVLVFSDGISGETKYVIDNFRKSGVYLRVYTPTFRYQYCHFIQKASVFGKDNVRNIKFKKVLEKKRILRYTYTI